MNKPLTKDDLMLASLKMLTSVYSIAGQEDISETLSWAVHRIEQLESQVQPTQHKRAQREPLKVIPFRRN